MESSFLIKRNYDLVVVIVVDISQVRFEIVFGCVGRSSDCDDGTSTTRDEQSKAEQSKATMSKAEQSIATMSKAEQSKAKYSKAEQRRAKQS